MIDIYLDCADLDGIRAGRANPLVKGFTTNPSLLRAAGVTDYEAFAKDALQIVDGLPISFEVFADDMPEMERQARKIASWGSNVNVKIPVTNTKGESMAPLVRKLLDSGIMCNVTAVFTMQQISSIVNFVNPEKIPVILSMFCGRIADSGIEPPVIQTPRSSTIKFLWASSREVLNIYQALKYNYDIITVTPDLLAKYEKLKGKDLNEFSLDTVKMFYNDAQKAGYVL